MKRLQILKFKERQTDKVYSLNTNTGNYEYNNDKFHLYSFFGKEVMVISVLDKLRGITFSVGDSVVTPLGNKEIISMQIVGGAENTTVQFTLFTNNAANTILMPNCTKVVLIAPTIIKTPTLKNSSEFEELQQRIIKDFNGQTLKFAVFVKKKSETFEEFKKQFFQRNNDFDTIYSKSKTIQTNRGRRRSLGDIFMICRYYYPNISLDTVIAWLYSRDYFKGQYCGTIKKRVWRMDHSQMYHEDYKDEYGNSISYYKTILNKI